MLHFTASKRLLLHFFLLLLITLTGCKKKEEEVIIPTPDPEVPQVKKFSRLDIVTNGNAAINSKETYVPANLSLDGAGNFSDFKGSTQIRGRGNTSWSFPKKSYKFKLDEKAGLMGMAPEKDWILLANYLDGTHLLNAVAMKTGQLMGLPFTNHIEPIEVNLNGQYLGLYMLTEQIEVKKNRVNIGDDGILLELDQYFDEPWKFRSKAYNLPVQVKYPELQGAAELAPIRTQFEQMEALIFSTDFPNNNYLDFVDVESLAAYLLVCMLCDNRELNHPKSTFLYKTKTGKWTMGPIWDFDWAFAYEGTFRHFSSFNKTLFSAPRGAGSNFFSRLMAAPAVKMAMQQKWSTFKAQKLPDLLSYIDQYSTKIEAARARDFQKWQRGNIDFNRDVVTLKIWLQNRAGFIDGELR
jgi:hypothetical protein